MKIQAKQINIDTLIENFKTSQRTESKNETATLGLTSLQKQALKGLAGQQGIGVSTLLGNIVNEHFDMLPYLDLIHEILPHAEKLKKHKDLLPVLLRSLSD